MRILSRYVQKQFYVYLALCFSGFLAVFIVVDLAGRLSGFIDSGVSGGTIFLYYTLSIPYMGILILPMAMLLASLFCFGNLARFGELAAMKSAGISLYSIALPVLGAALLVCTASFFLTDRVMPGSNRKRAAIVQGKPRAVFTPMVSQVVLQDVDEQILSVGTYFRNEARGEQVTLDRYEGMRLVDKLRAEEMRWHSGGWTFLRGEVRKFSEDGGEQLTRFRAMPAREVTLTPEDLSRDVRSADELSFTELTALVQRKQRIGDDVVRVQVARYMRVSFPFTGFVMALFGISLSARTQRAGKPLLVGICLLISFVYYGCIQAGRVMGWNGILPPFPSAWAANLLFLGLGAVMLIRTRR
ncbi:MAG: LptF/LptG family permease [Candidatus Latescibacteria bacterium]|nr:LptF/LptG family permease [Candidatus Latescibacterota bacterium]